MEMEQSVPQHVSKDQENFVKEFIQVYKDNPVLWDKKHPKYKSRDARNKALDSLLNKAKEYYPDVEIDFVKHKIDGLRGTFRKEYRKVMDSKKATKKESDVYIPTLWYFNLLLFTVGEEYNDNLQPDENFKNLYFWSREHTVILIDLFKKHPILYSFDGSNSTKSKRVKAYNQIRKELICETGKNFEVEEVKKKILTLKQQFKRECRIKENMGSNKPSKLWCYELLSFLKDYQTKKGHIRNDQELMSDDSTDHMFSRDDETQMEADNKDETIFLEETDDIFDTIGKNVAIKLRDMTDDQRKYAEDLINQVMYNGLMENLNSDSSLVLSTY